MGKTKQMKEKKFDRNVEISAPILDPEIIKAIHTPPKSQRLDLKYGGFKALLSDLNSQDSTDELTPLNDNHVPSYIGISCAVSGYSNYSSYAKKGSSAIGEDDGHNQHLQTKTKMNLNSSIPDRSRTASPTAQHHIHHITIDKNTIHSADQERKELTEKLTASANERRRSPSPCIPPTEDDRHHGAYVGARYCPLPPPSKLVNKHIPLLGIDDDQDPDDFVEPDEHKVEQKIASLYGDNFVEDWRESMTHKAKKELVGEPADKEQNTMKSPKDLVTLKPTPQKTEEEEVKPALDVPTPPIKVLGNVDKQFLNKLLTDENPPRPSQSPEFFTKTSPEATAMSTSPGPSVNTREEIVTVISSNQSLPKSPEEDTKTNDGTPDLMENDDIVNLMASNESQSFSRDEDLASRSPASPVSQDSQINIGGDIVPLPSDELTHSPDNLKREDLIDVSSPEDSAIEKNKSAENGLFYLGLLDNEKSFIREQIVRAEEILAIREDELDEDTVGKIRSAIGKANLLINKKCNQFKELCEANINESSVEGQFATLNDDLAGFWDMLSIQVSDVRKSFESLWEAEANDWQFVGRKKENADNDERLTQTSNLGSKPKLSAQKDQERRERLQEHINQMKQNQAAKSSADNIIMEDSTPAQLAATEQEEQMFSLMGEFDEQKPQQDEQ